MLNIRDPKVHIRLPVTSFPSETTADKTTIPNLSTIYPVPPEHLSRHTAARNLRSIDEVILEEGFHLQTLATEENGMH